MRSSTDTEAQGGRRDRLNGGFEDLPKHAVQPPLLYEQTEAWGSSVTCSKVPSRGTG